MSKSNKKLFGMYATLGSGIGLLFGIKSSNLALGLIFGFGIGLIIDSIVYSNKKKI